MSATAPAPKMFENKPWVCYWLLHSLDLLSIHSKKDYFVKNHIRIRLLLSKINLSKVFKDSNPSLFSLYSSSLFFVLIKKLNFELLDIASKKSVYYFLRFLSKNTVLPRNSKTSDCDGRNLFCIFIISSLYNILSLDLENFCVKKFRYIYLTRSRSIGRTAFVNWISTTRPSISNTSLRNILY